MKRLGYNIINTDDVSLVGNTGETLTDVVNQLDQLKGNIKWLYAHTKNVNMNIIGEQVKMKFITLQLYDELVANDAIDPDTYYLIEEE